MKILEVIGGSKLTGSASAALNSARAMAGRDHEVTWLCRPGSKLAAAGRAAGLEVAEKLDAGILGARRKIRELAAAADMVHVHRSREHLAALLALGFSRRKRPLARTCHAGTPGRMGLWARWLVGKCEALVTRSSDQAFALRAASAGGTRLAIIPGGVDETVFHPGLDGAGVRGELGLDGRTTVGIVSRLKAGRRLLHFLRAAEILSKDKRYDALAFLVVGRGELAGPLQRWTDKTGLKDRVSIYDPGGDFPAALAALDVGVLLVPGSDGSARTALEMAALGKPLILGRVGALADLAGPEGECARVVSPDSIEKIAAAIGELALDAGLRERLGAAARARFEERHTLEKLGAAYEGFFLPLVERAQ